jgi:DNA polymerase-3 subunit alpha
MVKAKFVHLHAHTEYSLLDGLPKIRPMLEYAKSLGMGALAMTDHGVMYGAIEFYKTAKSLEMKPIVGVEAYTVPGDHREKKTKEDKVNNHILLLAKNVTGYKNLMKLLTIAHLEGFYYRPRFSRELLKEYGEGLVCTSACGKGEIGQALMAGEKEKAREIAKWFVEVFGGDYYLEVQRHRYEEFIDQAKEEVIKEDLRKSAERSKLMNKGIIEISRELGIPLVCANDVHYIKPEDAMAQDVLVCVATGKEITETKRLRYVDTPTFYMTTPEEMARLFTDVPDAVANTLEIAEKCNLELTLGEWFFPKSETPEGVSAEEYLRKLTDEGVKRKFGEMTEKLEERTEYELKVICGKGYASYFLIMGGLAEWCREKGIITNTRGSAAGSLVSYVLDITTVDPMKYGLPFERFLNEYRPTPPDIDLDIADNRREELIAHMRRMFGKEKFAQICTFGRMMARGSVRDVARVLGYAYGVGDRIAKLIPFGSQGFPMTIKKALEISPELAVLYEADKDAKKVLDLAQQVEGNARHTSVHAAGVVASPTEITDYTPLQLEPKGTKVITQYELHACEDVGLIKFDILGIRHLSILGAAVEIVEQSRGEKVDLAKISIDDKATFAMLSRGETMGVFQLGGSGMTRYLKELQPQRVEDLMAMIALFRPGPIAIIPEYIARKRNPRRVKYYHPKMKKFLEQSYGLLVYQEDILFTAIELAGYTWKTVDKLRKAIGKKIPKEMAQQHKIFVEGCKKHSGIEKKEAEKLWELFEPFQGYGFNKAHAASYGMVSYQTGYMKAHYPVEYMTALLTAEAEGNSGPARDEKMAQAMAECRRMGVKVLPPAINISQERFTVEDNPGSLTGKAIRFGLSAIKNVGTAAIEVILEARKEKEFDSVTDFLARVDGRKVNKRVVESLIKAGAMDKFGSRQAMLKGWEGLKARAEKLANKEKNGQTGLFDGGGEEREAATKVEDRLPEVEEWDNRKKLAMEKELLGFYLAEQPQAKELAKLVGVVSHEMGELTAEEHAGGTVKIGGVVEALRRVMTKKGNQEMAFARIRDDSGGMEVVVFPKVFAKSKEVLVEEKVVVVEGKVEYREETLSVLADRVVSLSQSLGLREGTGKQEYQGIRESSKSGKKVKVVIEGRVIRVPAGTSAQKLVVLNKLLKGHPGDEEIALVFENRQGGEKRLKVPFGVEWGEEVKKRIVEVMA